MRAAPTRVGASARAGVARMRFPASGRPEPAPVLTDGGGRLVTLRVATFNIRNGMAPDRASFWWLRRGLVSSVVAEVDADLWGLQEVYGFQRRWLADGVLTTHRWAGSGRNRRGRGEGVYVAARRGRVALGDAEVRWFGSAPTRPGSKLAGAGFPRIVVLAEVRFVAHPVLVAVTHLDEKSADRRRASVEQLAGWLEREADGRPVVVMGDVNAVTGAPELAALDEIGLSAVLGPDDGGTSHGFGRRRPKQIDNLWVSDHWRVASARVVTEAGTASDHDPVVTELALP